MVFWFVFLVSRKNTLENNNKKYSIVNTFVIITKCYILHIIVFVLFLNGWHHHKHMRNVTLRWLYNGYDVTRPSEFFSSVYNLIESPLCTSYAVDQAVLKQTVTVFEFLVWKISGHKEKPTPNHDPPTTEFLTRTQETRGRPGARVRVFVSLGRRPVLRFSEC